MEQLTIKELIFYLPYSLNAKMLNYKCDYVGNEIDTIIGLEQWDKSGSLWSCLTIGGSKPSLSDIKPILRPLSDLIKEIEINGEKFVPIIEISKFLLGDRKVEDYGFSENKHYYYCETSDSINRQYCIFLEEYDLSLNISKKNFKMLEDRKNNIRESYSQLEYYNMLYKWHFDVFGLIKKGLAIDINTIK